MGVGETSYLDGVTQGLVLWLDPNRQGGVNGNIVTDHSNTMGDVNIQNRSSDWTIQTESSTSLKCIYNNSNRTSNPGINVPMNNGWNKQVATIEMWIRPTGDYTGGLGWFNNSDGNGYTNNSNWFCQPLGVDLVITMQDGVTLLLAVMICNLEVFKIIH